MIGNPIPGFAVAMIGIGSILTMGLVLEFMADVMLVGGDNEIEGITYIFALIGIILMICGVWTIIDSNRKMLAEK